MSRSGRKPKRRAIPVRVKREVRERQKGLCGCRKKCGATLPPDGRGLVNYQHEPPLALRKVRRDKSDWSPSQHDPRYIYAEMRDCHLEETYHPRSNATSLSSDRHAIDKAKRIRGEVRKKPKHKWAKRQMKGAQKFPKGQRKLQSRPWSQRKGA